MPAAAAEPHWFSASYVPPPGVYDEFTSAPGVVRPQWEEFREASRHLSKDEFERRARQAERMLIENGVAYNAFGESAELQRPWRLDLLPLVLGDADWSQLEDSLSQRARLLNCLIDDLYGPQRCLKEGWLPREVVFAHPSFQRAFHGLPRSTESSLMLYGAELARSPNGQWWVMADRAESPAGPGYALENRIITARMLPQVIHRVGVQRLAPFFIRLQNALRRRALKAKESLRIVLLSMGPRNSLFFEDVYLARYLGYTLVEGSDLAVRDNQVFLKTLSRLVPVDVIFSRGFESGIDPLELGGYAPQGVSGLLNAVRAGNVAVANTPGCGLVESPVFMAFLPSLCQRFLGEELRTPSIATWWLGDAGARREVESRFNDLVIKPAFHASGSEEILPGKLSAIEREALRARIAASPYDFVAQETVARSSAPVWEFNQLQVGHVAYRCFLVSDGDEYSLMPGGLIRMATDTTPMQLSINAGAESKDLWIQSHGPIEQVTLLVPEDEPVVLRRTGALFPSRVADDLYWLGSSLDRCDFLTRLLRSAIDRLALEDDAGSPALSLLMRALAEQGQIEPDYLVSELAEQLPPIEDALTQGLLNDAAAGGLARALHELRRLAARTRDWLSAETWHKLNQSAERFLSSKINRWDDLADIIGLLTELQQDLASVGGLIQNGMIRGPSWRFLELGRRIERARNIGSLIRSTLLEPERPSREVLRAVIDVLDCRMTYRTRYLDNIQPNGVFDLAMTDETNPNSIAFQVALLSDLVDTLPLETEHPLRTEEKRLVMAAVHLVRMLTPEALAAPDRQEVRDALEQLEAKLKSLSEVLNRRYLVHAGGPRQLLGDKEEGL
ncbi:MAG: circularly permuted type 2 ATP-grasp protein [Planctomycetaceae bacterium]